MTDATTLTARIDALEMHLAHQSQTIDDLNAAVAAQWSTIDGLVRHLGQLNERVAEAETRAGPMPASQKPPHY